MKTRLIISTAFLLVLFGTSIYDQDWPQFLSPDSNSFSLRKNLLRSWPENGPEVLWTANLGIGYGGPVVKEGKVYLLDRDDKVGDKLRCYDLTTGEELWKYEYEAPGEVMFPGSRSVPVVDDKHVYSCGPYGDLYCLDIHTHQPVWNVNIWTGFGGDPGNGTEDLGGFGGHGNFPIWAISQCPLIYGDLLVVLSQAPGAASDPLYNGGCSYFSPLFLDFNK